MTLLSIIVPTHNRQRYAVNAVQTLLTRFPEAEIVVSDTSADDSLLHALDVPQSLGRFVYVRPTGVRNIVTNYEHGWRSSTGEYVIFLGDDDLVGPHVIELAAWARANGIEALASSLPASYGWPDFHSAVFGAGYAATLSVSDYSGQARPLDAVTTLRDAADNLGGGPMAMPRAYLGMVSRTLVTRIETRYGSLFGGISPDIYSASLIAVESRNTVLLDYPFVLPGSSGASGSGLGAARRHVGGLWQNAHIASFPDLRWHPLIPAFYSVGTVWSLTLVRALEAIGRPDIQPGYARLYVKSLLLHSPYWREILAAARVWLAQTTAVHASAAVFAAVVHEFQAQARRVFRRIRHPRATGNALAIRQLSTVGDAFDALERIVRERPESIPEAMRRT